MTFNLLEQISVGFIGAALLLGLIRILIGPTAADRVNSANTMAVTVTAGLIVVAAYFNSALYLIAGVGNTDFAGAQRFNPYFLLQCVDVCRCKRSHTQAHGGIRFSHLEFSQKR